MEGYEYHLKSRMNLLDVEMDHHFKKGITNGHLWINIPEFIILMEECKFILCGEKENNGNIDNSTIEYHNERLHLYQDFLNSVETTHKKLFHANLELTLEDLINNVLTPLSTIITDIQLKKLPNDYDSGADLLALIEWFDSIHFSLKILKNENRKGQLVEGFVNICTILLNALEDNEFWEEIKYINANHALINIIPLDLWWWHLNKVKEGIIVPK